jgi:predicted nucleotidyltransferase
MAEKSIIEIVKKYVRILLEHDFPISSVFLFGSHAIGNAVSDSDIDILIVSPLFDEDPHARIGELWSLTRKVDTRLEPIPIGEKSFQTDHITPLLQIVRQTGLKIV